MNDDSLTQDVLLHYCLSCRCPDHMNMSVLINLCQALKMKDEPCNKHLIERILL